MRRVSGKNRLAIIALAVMIGVAGYMSFADAGKDKKTKKNGKEQVEVISYDEVAGSDSKMWQMEVKTLLLMKRRIQMRDYRRIWSSTVRRKR